MKADPRSARLVTLWTDEHPILGSGERHLIVSSIGRTKAHLYSASLMAGAEIDLPTFDRHAQPYDGDLRKVERILKRNRSEYRRLKLRYSEAQAQAALAALSQGRAA
jgi:hypothetical protein